MFLTRLVKIVFINQIKESAMKALEKNDLFASISEEESESVNGGKWVLRWRWSYKWIYNYFTHKYTKVFFKVWFWKWI
ncbi:hypothetical protein IJ00_13065 [Calothrix sp. 336/3]|nr:hypothetical protein IJ00_13065 [Calothrix sp. 336/3]